MSATATPDAAARYLELRARMDRLQAAEDRAFRRYMHGETSAATVRKAASRVNALSAALYRAQCDAVDDDGNLPGGHRWYGD